MGELPEHVAEIVLYMAELGGIEAEIEAGTAHFGNHAKEHLIAVILATGRRGNSRNGRATACRARMSRVLTFRLRALRSRPGPAWHGLQRLVFSICCRCCP